MVIKQWIVRRYEKTTATTSTTVITDEFTYPTEFPHTGCFVTAMPPNGASLHSYSTYQRTGSCAMVLEIVPSQWTGTFVYTVLAIGY